MHLQPVQRKIIPPNREALALPLDYREILLSLYQDGVPQAELCEMFNLSRPTIFRHRQAAGLAPRFPRKNYRPSLITKHYRSGWTKERFAKAGLNWPKVKRILFTAGIPLRPSRRYPNAKT